MTMCEFLGMSMIVVAVIGVAFQLDHLLSALLLLEVVPLGLYLYMAEVAGFMCLFMIAMSACEAAVGLSLLVTTARAIGSDYLDTLSSVKV
uniref:NADH-ubiquinone oxidoreductase chain 4L n=1 Tax=Laternula truncata TaxID=1199070 RepID=A0A1U9XPM8_9BIVA|nr:NADH dehydrogenase subunit 4L [Laternula truncata]AQZ26194.1 NADH dehydrogenase subunit 4L [Laternula truncata]